MTIAARDSSENMLERLQREQREIDTKTTPGDLAARQKRQERLATLVADNRFITSVWAYGLEEGQKPYEAPVLWIPYSWDVDSGRKALLIRQFQAVNPTGDPASAVGTGELERGRELLFGIFQTMAADGLVQPVYVPEQPVHPVDQWRR